MMKKIETNELNEEVKASMLTRILTGIGIGVVCIPCVVLGSWPFFFLVALIAIVSAIELTRITDLKSTFKVFIAALTVVMTLLLVYYIFYYNNFRDDVMHGVISNVFETGDTLTNNFTAIDISVMIIVLMAAIYFIISFFSPVFTVSHVFYFVTMVLVLAIGVQSFYFLRFSPFSRFAKVDSELITTDGFKYGQSMFLFLYVVIGVIMNDIGAYFIGVLFGKHKMNEKISPKKTWEGFLGGVVFSLISSTLFAIIVTYCGKPMLPMFDFTKTGSSNPLAVFFILFISTLLPLVADTGDFVFSAVKRYWGVKDFSQILPGHGGILDRVDSLIFSAALVTCLIRFIDFFQL